VLVVTILRLIGGSLCAVALILAAGFVGNGDYAAALVTEAMEKEARPARARAYYRELLCDCLKQNGKANLRLHIAHQPDRKLCKAACIYDDGTVTKGTL
jgi:hypothetical protein